jgi:hypothetical protein
VEPTRSNSCSCTQQRGLRRERQIADLVEEEGPAAGIAHISELVAPRAGECPLDVAEELALEQRLGQAAAVDGDERPGAARERVDGAGQHLLAGARLAEEEHRERQRRDAAEGVELLREVGQQWRTRSAGVIPAVSDRARGRPARGRRGGRTDPSR